MKTLLKALLHIVYISGIAFCSIYFLTEYTELGLATIWFITCIAIVFGLFVIHPLVFMEAWREGNKHNPKQRKLRGIAGGAPIYED